MPRWRQVVRLLNEPTAIAIARWHPAAVHETNLMVVDVGAAALQASLITVEHGVYEVRTRASLRRRAIVLCSTHSGPTVVPLPYVCTAHNAHLPVFRTTDHSRRRSMPLSNSAKRSAYCPHGGTHWSA